MQAICQTGLLENENYQIIYYEYDYNILVIHREVLNRFIQLRQLVATWKLEIQRLKALTIISLNEERERDKRISYYQEIIALLESDRAVTEYLDKVTPYLKQYQDIANRNKKVFGRAIEISEADLVERSKAVDGYFSIVSQYYPIKAVRQYKDITPLCPNCELDMESQPGKLLCQECGYNIAVPTADSYQQGMRKNISVTKNSYEDRLNYEKSIKRYKGEQPNKLPADLFTKLDRHFSSYGKLISSQVISMPLVNGKRGPYERESLFRALKEINYSGFYEDINLICHIYWGWDLPQIDHLEAQLMEDYDKSQLIYEQIKSRKGRSSCINVNYRLFRHLRRLGYPCRQEEFKMIKTKEILEDYEMIWKEICLKLDWIYEPLL